MSGGGVSNPYVVIFIALMAVLVVQLIVSYVSSKKQRAQQELPIKTVSVVGCVRGDYEIEKEFSEGDFVGRVVGDCPQCGAPLIIKRIFVVTVGPKQQKS